MVVTRCSSVPCCTFPVRQRPEGLRKGRLHGALDSTPCKDFPTVRECVGATSSSRELQNAAVYQGSHQARAWSTSQIPQPELTVGVGTPRVHAARGAKRERVSGSERNGRDATVIGGFGEES